ncbi:hypothetical protein K7432_009309 [Basidiobolus ranarum]|uniref:NlpC/P60 domain-containing protein n=1 Tax=Basidiobolus ranarum TaxID=34480 RepID=A0ABR2WQF3_9FUNG
MSDICSEANKWIGVAYQLGGNTKSGVDCSHLVHQVFKGCNKSYNYTTTGAWPPKEFRVIPKSDVQPGDVVKFAGHVGIMISQNEMISAESGSQNNPGAVKKSSVGPNTYWGKTATVGNYYRYQ